MVEANVSETIVKFMQEKGTDYIFGILSSGFMELGDILSDTELKYIGVRHEQWAGHMADAYGRISGKPQFCLIPGGPGITNMATPVTTAQINHSPMFVLSDGATTMRDGLGDFQDIYGERVLGPLAKDSRRVSSAGRVMDNLRSLYSISVTPLKGPVHLEISRDVLLETVTYNEESPHGHISRGIEPDQETMKRTLELLKAARKPVILAGDEVKTERGYSLLSSLANALDVPVCAVHAANDVMDNANKHMLGATGRLGSKRAMTALSDADLVIAVGTTMNPYSFVPYYGFKYPSADAGIIHVTGDSSSIGRTRDVKLGIVCSSEGFLESLLKLVGKSGTFSFEWSEATWKAETVEEALNIFKGSHNRDMFKTLMEGIPSDSTISVDAGSMSMVMLKWSRFSKPVTLLTSGNMGEVGFSMPSSIGAALARPDNRSFAVLGDGAFTMELPSLITAVEYNVPVKVIVFDNSAWGSEKAYQANFYDGRYFGSELRNPDLANLAKSIGAESVLAETPREAAKALKELNEFDGPGVMVVKMEDDFPTPVRSLDTVKRVKRGIFHS